MSNENYSQLSEDEIQQRLSSIETDRYALEKALERKRQDSKKELAEEIRDMILSRGYELAEILQHVGPKKRGARKSKSGRSYTRYVDPANPENVYVRGVLPKWMKEQMAAQGLDPKNKDDREAFKEQYLEKSDD